eukprot:3408209-Pyramimonas_sp.AAC.1
MPPQLGNPSLMVTSEVIFLLRAPVETAARPGLRPVDPPQLQQLTRHLAAPRAPRSGESAPRSGRARTSLTHGNII